MQKYYHLYFSTGKKAKSAAVSLDHDLADGLVDLEKLKSNMTSTVTRLQLEFKDKITVKVKPGKSKLNCLRLLSNISTCTNSL